METWTKEEVAEFNRLKALQQATVDEAMRSPDPKVRYEVSEAIKMGALPPPSWAKVK